MQGHIRIGGIHLRITAYYCILLHVTKSIQTRSCKLVELRMIHHDCCQIYLGGTQSFTSPIQLHCVSSSNVPVFEDMGQCRMLQTYATRCVALIASCWTIRRQFFIIYWHPSKWYPRSGLRSDSLMIIKQAPCQNFLLMHIITCYVML